MKDKIAVYTQRLYRYLHHLVSIVVSRLKVLRKEIFFRQILKQWSSCLLRTQQMLTKLTTSTESEFLSTGSMLQDFYSRSAQLSDKALFVAESLSGSEIDSAIEQFDSFFTITEQQEKDAEKNIERLRHVFHVLAELQDTLQSFLLIVKTLSVLSVNIKIEIAGLGSSDSGFETLASEIAKLSIEIKKKSDEINSTAETLIDHIRRTLSKAEGLQAIERQNAQAILRTTNENLSFLNSKHKAASGSAKRLSSSYGTISEKINQIVSSLQFHDITRQKLEHVQETLTKLKHQVEDGVDMKSLLKKDRLKNTLSEAVSVSMLQAAQLKDAEKTMYDEVTRIGDNMRGIVDSIINICSETVRLISADGGVGDDFLMGLEKKFSSIESSLVKYNAVRKDISEAMRSVTEAIGSISAFIKDIEKIGIEMKKIALNSQIRAAHIGSQGAALGELAEAARTLASDTYRLTDDITKALSEIAACSDDISAKFDRSEAHSEHEDAVAETFISAIRKLNRFCENLGADIVQMENDGQILAYEIEKSVKNMSVHIITSSAVEEICFDLDATADMTKEEISVMSGGEDSKSELLAEIERKYTMQRQRDIHNNFSTTVSDQPAEIAAPGQEEVSAAAEEDKDEKEEKEEKKKAEDDLGDNVELF